MRNGMITDKYGDHRWWVNDKLHRTDGPAVVYTDGTNTQCWYANDQLHREDGPAVIYTDGTEWWINGQRHRIDGPALIFDGAEHWYINGTIITDDVNRWMTDLDISYPFDEEHQALFLLTFGGK